MPWISHLVVIVILATVFHILLSSFGFTPTDDGFVLSGSRRILDGQMPHRDFISIHTPGSYFFHAPEVMVGGDYVLWVSRFVVWMQFTVTGWLWVLLVGRSFHVFVPLIEKVLATIVAIIFSAHSFPVMAWHTLDGIFISSLGVFLSYRYSRRWKIIGYFLLGTAPLFKQNYLLIIPLALVVIGDWRKWYLWLVAGSPLMIYMFCLISGGVWHDAVLQIGTLKSLYTVGVTPYQFFWNSEWSFLVGGLFFVLTFIIIFDYPVVRMKDVLLVLAEITVLLLLYFRIVGDLSLASFWNGAPFGLWTAVAIVTFFLAVRYRISGQEDIIKQSRSGLLLIGLAWSASISLGYNSPVLVAGPLVVFLIAYGLNEFRRIAGNRLVLRLLSVCKIRKFGGVISLMALLVLTMFGLNSFKQTRENNIFKEQPVSGLDEKLDGVLGGAQLIRTNINTYNVLLDLEVAKKLAGGWGSSYSIIPDIAANWIKSKQPNVLSIDWTFIVEVTKGDLLNRVINDLESNRKNNVVIVQKCKASLLFLGCHSLGSEYALVNYVAHNFNMVDETKYFILYR